MRWSIAVMLGVLSGLSGLVGCEGSVEADANTGKKVADFDKPMDQPMPAPSASADAPETALIGARQDLGYRGPPSTTCGCLAVALGQPGDPPFHWSGPVPKTDPNSEVVIALTSAGQTCPSAAPQSLGASYWGYEVVGGDVVVVVEPAMPGRPIASGAIIPRPANGGHVFVRPSSNTVPYGKGPTGAPRCAIQLAPPPPPAPGAPAPANFGSVSR